MKIIDLIKDKNYNSSYNNVIYITSNEFPLEVETLARAKQVGFAALGTSCLASLNLFSHRKNITAIYIVDISLKVMSFWKKIVPILGSNERKEVALNKIGELITKNKNFYFAAAAQAHSQKELKNISLEDVYENTLRVLTYEFVHNISFLTDDNRYRRIHAIARNGNITFFRADFRIPAHTAILIHELKDCRFDTVYTSNIIECLQGENIKTATVFFNQIRKLNQPQTQLSHLVFATRNKNRLTQQIQIEHSERFIPQVPINYCKKISFITLSILAVLLAAVYINYRQEKSSLS